MTRYSFDVGCVVNGTVYSSGEADGYPPMRRYPYVGSQRQALKKGPGVPLGVDSKTVITRLLSSYLELVNFRMKRGSRMFKSLIDSVDDSEFSKIVESSKSISEVGRKLGFRFTPGYNSKLKIKKRIELLNIHLGKESVFLEDYPETNTETKELVCLNCGEKFTIIGHRKQLFCSSKCSSDFRYKEYIKRWKSGEEDGIVSPNKYASISGFISRYIHQKYGEKCALCGFDKRHPTDNKSILEIHHRDGNCKNNKEENLILLCPNCHALTDNYRGRNADSKRSNERKRKLDA